MSPCNVFHSQWFDFIANGNGSMYGNGSLYRNGSMYGNGSLYRNCTGMGQWGHCTGMGQCMGMGHCTGMGMGQCTLNVTLGLNWGEGSQSATTHSTHTTLPATQA